MNSSPETHAANCHCGLKARYANTVYTQKSMLANNRLSTVTSKILIHTHWHMSSLAEVLSSL